MGGCLWNVSVCFFIGVCRGLGRLLSVACGMCRYVFYRCVSVACVVASFCLHSLSIFSSRLFSSFLVYSLISYSSIFEYVRLLVECVGCLGECPVLLKFTVYLLFSYVLFFSRIFFSILFNYILSWTVACGMYRYVFYRCVSVAWEIAVGNLWNVSVCFFIGVCRLLGWLPRFA